MVTPKGSMSTEGDTPQVSVLPYRCSVCPTVVTRQMSILQNSKTQNALLFPVHIMFRHDCPLAVKPASTPRRLLHKKALGRDSLPVDMLLSAVSVLVVAQTILEVLEGLMNYPVQGISFIGSLSTAATTSCPDVCRLSMRNRIDNVL